MLQLIASIVVVLILQLHLWLASPIATQVILAFKTGGYILIDRAQAVG